jgi:hypothetical protein
MRSVLCLGLILATGCAAAPAEDDAESALEAEAVVKNPARFVANTWQRSKCELRRAGAWTQTRCSDWFASLYFAYPIAENRIDQSGSTLNLVRYYRDSDQPGTRYRCNLTWLSSAAGTMRCSIARSASNEPSDPLVFSFAFGGRQLVLATTTERWTYAP